MKVNRIMIYQFQIKNNKEERKKTSEVKDVKSVYKMPNEIDYDYKYLEQVI